MLPTHHSTGNLVCKGYQVHWSQLSQSAVRLLIGGGNLWEWRRRADTTVAEQWAVRGRRHGGHGAGDTGVIRGVVDVFIAIALHGLR